MNIGIPNSRGERLDAEIDGIDGPTTVIFVHGFGTNKDEGALLFVDIVAALASSMKTIRFDFSGFGNSEGKQEEVSLDKMAGDLRAVIDWAHDHYFSRKVIVAHSLGTTVTSFLCPSGIERSIFTGLPRGNTDETVKHIQHRITSRPGGVFNPQGISYYMRTSGERQKIGPQFWSSLVQADVYECYRRFSLNTELTLIRPADDLSYEPGSIEAYRKIRTANYIETPGDHAFAYKKDRNKLIKIIKRIVEEQ